MSLLVAAVVAFGLLAAIAVADLGGYLAAGVQASTAADGAALAAAPETFHSFGALSSPAGEAARFAGLNGAELLSCSCAVDPSWQARTVEVVVQRTVRLVLFGDRAIRAIGRAEFVPTLLK
jgi:hypothetical protein